MLPSLAPLHVLVKETFNEFDQSCGRVVSSLLSQKGEWLSRRTDQRPQQPESWLISVLSLHRPTLSSRHQNRMLSQLLSLLAQVTTEMWVMFLTTHDTELTPRRRGQVVDHVMISLHFRVLNLTREDLWRHWLCRHCQLLAATFSFSHSRRKRTSFVP